MYSRGHLREPCFMPMATCSFWQALFGTLTPDVMVLTVLYSIAGLGIAIVNDFKSIEGDRWALIPPCCSVFFSFSENGSRAVRETGEHGQNKHSATICLAAFGGHPFSQPSQRDPSFLCSLAPVPCLA